MLVQPEDIAAARKKTDEASPDDEEEEQEAEKEGEESKTDIGAGGDPAADKGKSASDSGEVNTYQSLLSFGFQIFWSKLQ
jgi:hypothetical protein